MNSAVAQTILHQQKINAPTEAESLCLVQSEVGVRALLLAAGNDPLGLVYALTELADRARCLGVGLAALEFVQPVIERPASRTRSVMRAFSSELEDKGWFYDRDCWRTYLNMLVTSRVNRLAFTMGMGYNSAVNVTDGYFVFPYPFFVTVPGFDVTAKGLSADERDRNLATLKFIGEECGRRGLRFQLGIWTLAYVWNKSPRANYTIAGLTDDTHPAYCRDALAALLREIPAVTGVTFRVHSESGIPQGHHDFWKTQFSAIANCGRRMEIDMHAKNMEAETLDAALATGQPTVVSPKYCGEHLCLPYHPASIREREMGKADDLKDTGEGLLVGDRSFTRYGYADMLAENRTWDVVFRIWPGTQRFLLNGDPALFAGYAHSASFCGAAGIEWPEPLFFKGREGSGIAGGRCAYADTSLTPRYDFEKYLYTYRIWGRLGYDPDANPEVWRRALRQEFGDAALAVEKSLAPVTRVLPLITLVHGRGGDCQLYWPEIYTNMPVANTEVKGAAADTRLPALFGNVSSFDPQLFHSPDEYAEALVAGRATGKYSPLEAAQWLEEIALAASTNLATARKQLGDAAKKPSFRRVEEDVLIQSAIATFFADRFRSAVLWQIYTLTGHRAAADAAIARYAAARDAWAAMSERAKGVYISDITYCNTTPIRGHWLDRIPAFDADIADLKRRIESPVTPANQVEPAAAARAFRIATAKPSRPVVAAHHSPPENFQSGEPLAIALNCGAATPRRVVLNFRPIDQAERWRSTDMKRAGAGYGAEIPGDYTARRYALQYYFEIQTGPAEATLFPPLAADLANFPYYVVRHKTTD
jgi:hypothetical protein